MRVKQDLLHIFKRWSDHGVKKTHGAFAEFMQRLREAFFIPEYGDLHFIEEQLRKSGMSEEDIQRKFYTDFEWFLQRCRRSVPPPPELERTFLAVVETYKDIKNAKTGEKLFGKNAWA